MERWREWQKGLESRADDIRAEAFVTQVMKEKPTGRKVLLFPNGGFKRAYSKDIAKITEPDGTELRLKQAIVEVNRRGIYDHLPEGLFHQPKGQKHFKSVDEVKSLVLNNKETAKNARRFFWPLDHEILAFRMQIEKSESDLISGALSAQSGGLKTFWELPKLPKDVEGKLIVLLPLAHKIAGNLSLGEQTIGLILDIPIKLTKKPRLVQHAVASGGKELGGCALGVDSALGNKLSFWDYIIKVDIGPLNSVESAQYKPSGSKRAILELLFSYFLPAAFECEVEIIVLDTEKKCIINGEFAHLGVNTFLN